MRVDAGSILHLRGGNGAGKTSLIRVLAGLTPPESGAVRYGSDRVSPHSIRYRECLRYIAHRDGVKLELTARENLRIAARLLSAASAEEVDATLDRVGLDMLGGRRCAELSAGQRRRVALARLLLGNGALWLLDEPLTSLDAAGVQLVQALVREHLAAGGIAVLATHQPLPLAGMDVIAVNLPQLQRDVH